MDYFAEPFLVQRFGESNEESINASFVDGFMTKQKVGHKMASWRERIGRYP